MMIWLEVTTVMCIAILLINRNIFNLLSNISSLHPMPLVLSVIGGCILLITIIISFHSNVFTDHDRYHEKINPYGSKKNAYEWLDLTDVFRFPINQLLIDEYFKSDNNFDFFKENSDSSYVLLIVDKTFSTFENTKNADKFSQAKRDLIGRARKINKEIDNQLNSLNQFSDVLSIAIAANVLQRERTILSVDFYYGTQDNETAITHTPESICGQARSKQTLPVFTSKYMERVNDRSYTNNKKGSAKSNFNDLIKNINLFSLDGNTTANRKVNLIFVSDFIDDSDVDSLRENFRNNLSYIAKKNVETINIFQLKSLSNRSLPKTNELINCFGNIFSNRTNIQKTDCDKTLINNTNLHFDDAIVKSNFNLSDGPIIDAFYYSDNMNNLRNAFTSFYLNKNGKPANSSVRLCLKSLKGTDPTIRVLLNETRNMYLGQSVALEESSNKFDIEFPQSMIGQDHYYLDIIKTGPIMHRIQAPIVFKQQLTRTSSEIIIFLYSMLFSAGVAYLLVIFWGLFRHSWDINEHNKTNLQDKWSWEGWKKNNHIIVTVLILILSSFIYASCLYIGAKYFHSSLSNKFNQNIILIFVCSYILPVTYIFFLIYLNFKEIKTAIKNFSKATQ